MNIGFIIADLIETETRFEGLSLKYVGEIYETSFHDMFLIQTDYRILESDKPVEKDMVMVSKDNLTGYIESCLPQDTGIDWKAVKAEISKAELTQNEDGQTCKMVWIGTQTSVMPSGKIYAFWTTNQTAYDLYLDDNFLDMLTKESEQHGLDYEFYSGDLFIVQYVPEQIAV